MIKIERCGIMGEYFLGIDIGTSSVRAVLFDRMGTPINFSSSEYPLITSIDGKAELDPELIFYKLLGTLKSCINFPGFNHTDLYGIGLSCQMHSLMAVDCKGNPLTNLITWVDTRAKDEAKVIETRFDVKEMYEKTGCRVQHPMYPLSKLLWLKHNNPEIFNKAYKFITFKEYMLFKLYGYYIVDYTLASSQGYFNIHTQKWDYEIVHDILQMSEDKLSDVVECTYALRGFKQEYENMTGISKDTPLIIGSGDGIAANIGCGVSDDTSISSTIGTSGALRTTVSRPILDPQQRTWCYSFTKDMWVFGGAINNGGIVLKWLREVFKRQFENDACEYNESVYNIFDRFASEIEPGSKGLIFLPLLTGERSPDWNSEVRGLMYGLSYSHSRKHIIRAAMEGIMYRMYSVYEILSNLSGNILRINANGGYAKSDVWLQIQADIFNKEIIVPRVSEASALGAAYLTMISLGCIKDYSQLLPGMYPQKIISPIREHNELYSKIYESAIEIYNKIYPQSKGD